MKVAFLDRDGTMIYEPPDGLVRPQDFRVLSDVTDTLRRLKERGYELIMVSNQDFTKSPVHEQCFMQTQEIFTQAMHQAGVQFTALFYCPHPEVEACDCRKPKTGMVDAFLKKNKIDRAASFVVGDREENDGGLAKNLGVRFWKMESNGTFPSVNDLLNMPAA